MKEEMNKPVITSQHTYTFPFTGESVTLYNWNDQNGWAIALSLSYKTPAEKLDWTSHYEGILQIKSKVNPKIWYMVISDHHYEDKNNIPIERVMMVSDCNAERTK